MSPRGLTTASPGQTPEAETQVLLFQELFSKQKGYLDEELDYRKQALDQAHKVRDVLLDPVGAGWKRAVCLRARGGQCVPWGSLLHMSLWCSLTRRAPRMPHCLSANASPHEHGHTSRIKGILEMSR